MASTCTSNPLTKPKAKRMGLCLPLVWTPSLYEPKVKILPPTLATAESGRFWGEWNYFIYNKLNKYTISALFLLYKHDGQHFYSVFNYHFVPLKQQLLWSKQNKKYSPTFTSLISEIHSFTSEFSFPSTANLWGERSSLKHTYVQVKCVVKKWKQTLGYLWKTTLTTFITS